MAYLFPYSITLIFRQSFNLSSLLVILATRTCLVAERNIMSTNGKYVTKQKGYESHTNHN